MKLVTTHRRCSCGSQITLIVSDNVDLTALLEAWDESHPDGGYVGKSFHARIRGDVAE